MYTMVLNNCAQILNFIYANACVEWLNVLAGRSYSVFNS